MAQTLTGAMNAIIALLQNCTLADAADFKQHAYYKTVRFKPEYPLGSMDIPIVTLSPIGGSNEQKGLGQWERWHYARIQLDMLAETWTYVRRIYEKVREVVLYDQNGDAAGTEGTYGTRYLYGQGLKSVEIGEAHTSVWDEEGRVARMWAEMRVEFTD